MEMSNELGPLQISKETQAELDYTMRKGYPSGFNGDHAAELDSLISYLRQHARLFAEAEKMAELLKWYADSDMAPNMDKDARALLLRLEVKDGQEGE
ncbi:hypothetical protein LCGC14_1374530 [marine sediment metagenome]|uniref:Uncharacterized protein n=1 Tax=marine sediment metagenome TaxID=412755 RepID=A0A0F9N6F1_9ZZZZ